MAQSKPRKKRYLPLIAIALAVSGLGVGAIAFVRGILHGGPEPTKKVVQEIHVIRPPPPPPDLPPPPPPPPEEKVNVPDPQNKPDPTQSDEPPPSTQLGLDAEGTAGGDDFGLVGNKGGRELTSTGGSAFAWYAGLLKNEILDKLGTQKRARTGEFSVDVRVWVRDDGTIDHVRVVQSSGDRERDRDIEAALSRISRLSQAPPAGMPEPISLRIVSRG
jgi:protein TonB